MHNPFDNTSHSVEPSEHDTLIRSIDDVLPQTQCGQCGYNGCLPYAQAIAQGQAPINRCPPGGDEGIQKLSALLNTQPLPLDSRCGEHKPRLIAHIAPEHCIGCTLCIEACPVDAIVGGNKKRHAVIAALCTGCELCIPPCPVDCITMHPVPGHTDWDTQQAHQARDRMHIRNQRLTRVQRDKEQRLQAKALQKLAHLDTLIPDASEQDKKRAVIQAALARARSKRAS